MQLRLVFIQLFCCKPPQFDWWKSGGGLYSHGVGFDQSLVLAQGIIGTALTPSPRKNARTLVTSRTFPSILQQFVLLFPECLRVYTKHNFSAICPLVKLHIMFLGKMNTGAHGVWICLKCPLAASKSFARCISGYPLLAACWLCLNCHCCSHSNGRIQRKTETEPYTGWSS
jgi:hypothetical protein